MVKIAGWQNWPVVETDCEGVSLLLSSAAAAADIHGKKPAALYESAAAADVHSKKSAEFLHHFSVPRNSPPC